jgi:hypothetical protein
VRPRRQGPGLLCGPSTSPLEARLFRCPHCHRQGLTFWGKFSSHASRPVRCRYCGELSFANAPFALLVAILSELLLYGSIFAALYYRSWLPFLVAVLVFAALQVAHLLLPATRTTPGTVRRVRWLQVALLVVFVLAIIVMGRR